MSRVSGLNLFVRQALLYPLTSPFLPPPEKVEAGFSYAAGSLIGTLEGTETPSEPSPADLLLHLDDSFDDAVANLAHDVIGSVTLSGTTPKFGAASALFNPTSPTNESRIRFASNTIFNWTADLTIDLWARYIETSMGGTWAYLWCNQQEDHGLVCAIRKSTGTIMIGDGTGVIAEGTTNIKDGQYHHIALTIASDILRLFIDGTQEGGNISYTPSFGGGGAPNYDFWIGMSIYFHNTANETSRAIFSGNIDEFRLVKNQAVWTENFTPPAAAYTLA